MSNYFTKGRYQQFTCCVCGKKAREGGYVQNVETKRTGFICYSCMFHVQNGGVKKWKILR